MDEISCPQCDSIRTLSSLRRKLRDLKDRIAAENRRVEEEKRKALAAARAAVSAIKGGGTLNLVGSGLVGISNSRTFISLGQIEGGRISNDDQHDVLAINDAHLETCADCGTFYAPNVRSVADGILKEIYDLDLLGAMAEIYDGEDAPLG